MARAIKVKELDGKKIQGVSSEGLKGTIVVLNSEESEIAKNLKIEEKGIYSMKT